jgi:hypothetical protein
LKQHKSAWTVVFWQLSWGLEQLFGVGGKVVAELVGASIVGEIVVGLSITVDGTVSVGGTVLPDVLASPLVLVNIELVAELASPLELAVSELGRVLSTPEPVDSTPLVEGKPWGKLVDIEYVEPSQTYW